MLPDGQPGGLASKGWGEGMAQVAGEARATAPTAVQPEARPGSLVIKHGLNELGPRICTVKTGCQEAGGVCALP
jgi:hypothetical protein